MHTIGVEIDGMKVRALHLKRVRGRYELVHAREQVEETLQIACAAAVGDVGEGILISAVDSTDVMVRQLSVDVAKDRQIAQVRDFQVEPLLPFPLDEALIDHVVLERDKSGAKLAVLSVLKSRMGVHLEQLALAGLEPEQVSCGPVALASLVNHQVPSAEPVGILHVGEGTTTCVIALKGKVLASRGINLGCELLEEGIDWIRFDAADVPEAAQRGERLRTEIAKTFYAMTHKGKGLSISQIFVTGEIGDHQNLVNYLAMALDVPLTSLPGGETFLLSEERLARYAIPLGLALQRQPAIDFRQQDYALSFPWKRLRKRIITYASLCLVLAFSCFFLGKALFARQNERIRTEYRELVHLVGAVEEPLLPEEMVTHSRTLTKSYLQGLKETFPLVPDLPQASDVLAWLATELPPIQLKEMRYQLVRRPEERRPKERYQVRLDLEFNAESPTIARAFHDALIADTLLVDPKGEIKWTTQKGVYKASVLLKDKTRYTGSVR